MSPGRCAVCEDPRLSAVTSPPGVSVFRCAACGHRTALHEPPATPQADYHEQYDGGPFLDALRATRIRQAGRLIELLRRHVPDLSRVVDYGAGRGWFLAACRGAGAGPLAGLDTSPIAVSGLAASGLEALLLPEDETGPDTLSRLSFRPRVVTLLDVVEHFPLDTLKQRLLRIVAACGDSLELVVVKVPVPGLLYAGAAALRRASAPGPLRQLYQVGTRPPHIHYFSAVSIGLLLDAAGLREIAREGDPDFEPSALGARIGAGGPAAQALSRVAGEALAAAVRASGRFDSIVVLGAPKRRV